MPCCGAATTTCCWPTTTPTSRPRRASTRCTATPGLGVQGHAQRGRHGHVLVRPHDPRIRPRDLEHRAPARSGLMLHERDVQLLCQGRHGDPFGVLGLHPRPAGDAWLAAFLPGASQVVAVAAGSGEWLAACNHACRRAVRGPLPGRVDYRLQVIWADGQTALLDDPYRFGPVLGEMDAWLLGRRLAPAALRDAGRRRRAAWTAWPAAASRCGRRTPCASAWSATSTTGTAAATRCGCAASAACGRSSCPAWAPGARYKFELLSRDGPAAAEGRPLRAPGRTAPGHRQRGGATAAAAAGWPPSASAPTRWTRR
jgi:1,4-alpha-glucan branching enzyme